jgi:hypothetical protein
MANGKGKIEFGLTRSRKEPISADPSTLPFDWAQDKPIRQAQGKLRTSFADDTDSVFLTQRRQAAKKIYPRISRITRIGKQYPQNSQITPILERIRRCG